MKVIAIFNQKGGVGKSTTASNLMAELTARGNTVLGIDTDPQAHLTKFLSQQATEEGICELLSKATSFNKVVQASKYGDFIPSDRSLATRLNTIANGSPAFVFILRKILSEQTDTYDYVIIDCPPAVNQLTVATLVASDYVLIPTEAEYFSIDGVSEISRTIAQVKDEYLNPTLKVLGIVLTRYRANLAIAKQMKQTMEQNAEEVFGTRIMKTQIPFTCDIPESQIAQKSIQDYKPSSKACKAYRDLTEEILEELAV